MMKSYIVKIGLVAGVIGIIVFGNKSGLISNFYDSTSSVVDDLAGSITRTYNNIFKDSSLSGREYEIVYKWKDASGKYHYGSEPPQGEKDVVKIKIFSDQNVVHLKKPRTASAEDTKSTDPDSGEKNQLPDIMDSYNNPVKKAIDARKKMEQRNRKIEEALQ